MWRRPNLASRPSGPRSAAELSTSVIRFLTVKSATFSPRDRGCSRKLPLGPPARWYGGRHGRTNELHTGHLLLDGSDDDRPRGREDFLHGPVRLGGDRQ